MKRIVLIFWGLLSVIIANSQVSQDSALAILRNNIVNYDDCDVYTVNSTIGIDDTIQLLNSGIIIPPQSNSWMFFVDEMPLANWSHPCKYVFINANSGIFDIINSYSPPINKSLDAIKTFSRVSCTNQNIFKIEKQRLQNTLEHNYAVIINGGANRFINHERYWNNCAALYSILVNKYGYDRNKIYVIMSDGTDSGIDRHLINLTGGMEQYDSSPLDLDGDYLPDIQYAATKTNISSVFNSLSNIITSQDEVFVFTTDHGDTVNNQYVLYLWNDETLSSTEFAAEINKINNARAINILMQQCFSGGFLSALCGDNRVVMTACSNYQVSHSMSNQVYDEFCYHWFCAMNGEDMDHNIVDADDNGDGYVSMWEAYYYAKEADTQPETPLYCSNGCQEQGDYDYYSLGGIIPIHISSNTTWSTSFSVYQDVIVDEGKTLTITGTISLATNVKIVVRPGGKLVVDGGTITNQCSDKMWDGIYVVGNKNQRQLAQYQGTVEIKNGSLIENARCAIATWDGSDDNTSGGIVKCSTSTFKNNGRCADFLEYTNHTAANTETNNVSYFSRCNFIADDYNLFDANNVWLFDFIRMQHVKGISISACLFEDQCAIPNPLCYAIKTIDAGYTLKEYCSNPSLLDQCICNTTPLRSSIKNVAAGVYACNSGTNYTVNVKKTDFELCGIATNIVVTNNFNFTENSVKMFSSDIFSYGIYMGLCSENSSGYKVEGNNFYSTNTSAVSGVANRGICVTGSGNDYNSIYRNTFDKLNWGIRSDDNPGLQFQCNEFSSSFGRDIYIISGISSSQGSCSKSAGNKFTSGVTNISMYNSNAMTYYYSGNNDPSNVYYPSSTVGSITKTGNITANDCGSTICINNVPILSGHDDSDGTDIALYESLQQIYESRLADYDAAGYDFLLENFEENDADIVATARLMQDTLISIRRTMAEIANHNIDAILQDTVIFDREALNGWYNRINTQTAKYSLVNSYFEMGEYALARQELTSIPQRFALTADEQSEYDNFCQYQSLRELVYSSGRNYAQLTEEEIAELQRIVERNTGVSSAYANSVLCFFYGICRDEEIDIDFDIDAPMNSKSTTEVVEENAEPLAIYVYPNPADEELNILLNSLPEGKTMIEFHDVTGRLVLSEEIKSANTSINISSLRQGVYMYRIVNGDNVIARDRIVKE